DLVRRTCVASAALTYLLGPTHSRSVGRASNVSADIGLDSFERWIGQPCSGQSENYILDVDRRASDAQRSYLLPEYVVGATGSALAGGRKCSSGARETLCKSCEYLSDARKMQ